MSDVAQEVRQRTLIRFPTDLDFTEIQDTTGANAYDVDDAGMKSLATLSELTALMAWGSYTDEGLKELAALSHLEELSLSSSALTVAGIQALAAGASSLRSLSVSLGSTSPSELAAIAKAFPELTSLNVTSSSISIDHLTALRSLDKLETLSLAGGGDCFGGSEAGADPLTGLEVLKRLPGLKNISARWKNGASMLTDDALVAMMKKRPGITVNNSWLDPSVFSPSASGKGDTILGDGTMLELTTDSFDDIVNETAVALVEFCTSAPNICRRNTFAGEVLAETFGQLAPLLKDRATVAKVDVHESPELGERFGVFGGPDVLVFRHGQQVGKLGVGRPSSILIQMKPLLDSVG